jgi:hypothetical protein
VVFSPALGRRTTPMTRWKAPLCLSCLIALLALGVIGAAGAAGRNPDSAPGPGERLLAQAESPSPLALVPSDAALALVAPNLRQLSDSLAALSTSLGLPATDPMADLLGTMRAQLGISAGLREDGPAVLWLNGILSSDFVALVPVTDFGAFLAAVGGTAGAPVSQVTLGPMGVAVYVRELGDFAVLATTQAGAEGATLTPAASLADGAGTLGRMAVARGQVSLVVNLDRLAPVILPLLNAAWTSYEQMFQSPSVEPGAGATLEAMLNVYRYLFTSLLTDTSVTVLSLDLETDHAAFDWTWQFKPGSDLAQAFPAGRPAGDRLAHLPDRPYFGAFSVCLEGLQLTNIFDQLAGAFPAEAGGYMQSMHDAIALARNVSALTFAWYAPADASALDWSQLFDVVAAYEVGDVAAYRDSVRQYMQGLNGVSVPLVGAAGTPAVGVLTYHSDYTPGVLDIDGLSVDRYDIHLDAPEGMTPDAMPGAGVLMAFGNHSGYAAAPAGGGVLLMTTLPDEAELRTALTAHASSDGLGARADLTALRAQGLTEAPFFEGYLDAGQIARVAQAALASEEADLGFPAVPADLAPMGFFAYAQDAGLAGRAVVPTADLRYLVDCFRALLGPRSTPI